MKKLITLLTFGLLIACDDGSNQAEYCSATNTNFQNLYTTTLNSNSAYTNMTTMDLLTHEYSFTVSAAKNICAIGYQGNATMQSNNLPYTIEVFNSTTSTMIFTGTNVFNSTAISYFGASGTLSTGNTYVVRRIIPASGYLGDLNNTIGRVCAFNSGGSPFPVSSGDITIISSNFYGTGGPIPNFGIPYIDIVFE